GGGAKGAGGGDGGYDAVNAFVGTFRDGRKDGVGVLYAADGVTVSGTWAGDMKHGPAVWGKVGAGEEAMGGHFVQYAAVVRVARVGEVGGGEEGDAGGGRVVGGGGHQPHPRNPGGVGGGGGRFLSPRVARPQRGSRRWVVCLVVRTGRRRKRCSISIRVVVVL